MATCPNFSYITFSEPINILEGRMHNPELNIKAFPTNTGPIHRNLLLKLRN
jgi:hypothetical protein